VVALEFNKGGTSPIESPSGNPTLFINLSALSNSGTTVSATYVVSGSTLPSPAVYNLATFLIANSPNTAFNGACTSVVWNTTKTALTCTLSTITGSQTSATATASLNTGAINLRPIAEVTDVRCSNLQVTGCFLLEPNLIQFATNDTVEEEHGISSNFNLIQGLNAAWNPYALNSSIGYHCVGAGCGGGGTSLASAAQLDMENDQPDSYYIGEGGNLIPLNGLNLAGNYDIGFLTDHGPSAANGAFIYIQHSLAQLQDPSYSYPIIFATGNGGGASMDWTPNTNVFDLAISGTGIMTATNWTFNGITTFTNGIAGSLTPSSSSAGVAAISATNTVTGASGLVQSDYCPNVVSSFICYDLFGHDNTLNDSIAREFSYISNGSTSNRLSFVFAGSVTPLLSIVATGAIVTEDNTLDDGSGNSIVAGNHSNLHGVLLPSTATGNAGTSTGLVELVLTGTTATITGTSLTASCDSGTASVSGAVAGHPVSVSSTTGADVGGAFNLRASVTSANLVTVYVCGTGTPASLAYNVTVF
jgi:hypothetical protein